MSAAHLTLAERMAVQDLYADYAAALSNNDYERWPSFFTEDAHYRIQARENFDQGLPLATLSFESRKMLEDRVYGVRNTLYHQPYYQRLVLGPHRVLRVSRGAAGTGGAEATVVAECECNYAAFRTKANNLTDILSVGRSLDTFHLIPTPEDAHEMDVFKVLIAKREVIFDSELIPNSLIYPL
jgi:salicylate 5-hydroxylase small subunit